MISLINTSILPVLGTLAAAAAWLFQRVERAEKADIEKAELLGKNLELAARLEDPLLREMTLQAALSSRIDGVEIDDIAKAYTGRAATLLRKYETHAEFVKWDSESKTFVPRVKRLIFHALACFATYAVAAVIAIICLRNLAGRDSGDFASLEGWNVIMITGVMLALALISAVRGLAAVAASRFMAHLKLVDRLSESQPTTGDL